MKPQKTIRRTFYVLFCLFIYLHSYSQQKIQIKDGTKDVGHFSVEMKQNLPGKPMVSFSGNGGEIVVDQESNSFVIRMQNFVWYEMDENPELIFNTDEITFKTKTNASVVQNNTKVTLKPLTSYIREIYFQVEGTGNVKMSIPFRYSGGRAQFFQEFTIKTKQDEIKELSSRDIAKIWRKVDRDDKEGVQAFLAKYGDSPAAGKYVKIANRAMEDIKSREMLAAEEARIKGQKVEKTEKDVKPKEIVEGELDSEKLVEDVKTIVDSLKLGEPMKDELVIYNLSLINGEKINLVEISDTEMPLQLNLKEVGANEMSLINAIPIPAFTRDSALELNSKLLKENNIKGVFNNYNIVNAQGIELYSSPIILENTVGGKNTTSYLIYGLVALLAGFGLFVFFNKRNKDKVQAENKKKIQQKIAENKINSETSGNGVAIGKQVVHQETPLKTSTKKGKIVIGQKAGDQKKVADLTPKHSIARSSGGSSKRIKITKKKKAGQAIEYSEFVGLVNSKKTVNVDLLNIWQDSRIENVYLAPQFIKELDNFLAESSNEGIQNELQGAVPEVGGFLMGRFSEKNSALQVLIEKFVAFVPEYNDVFKIEIGTKTIVDELGDAQDKNPQLEVIGWFHTHPGHGLFLSTSDLSVQRHFPKDYQVAMEIDSLTKGLDMSFFTRQSSGRMNNSTDRKEGVGWFQWVDIENSNLN